MITTEKPGMGVVPGTVVVEAPGRGHVDIAEAAVKAGVSIIQLRDKNASSRKLFDYAAQLREITKKADVLLIINDRIDIALAVEADGVHLGQDDLTLKEAKRILGNDYIIGISATCFDEAVVAARDGADYIGLGPIYPTPSKDDATDPIGIEGLISVRKVIDIPIVAIGGITADNIVEVVRAGADGIAVISAVASAPNMVEAATELNSKIKSAKL